MRLIDISQRVTPDSAVFGGDTPFSIRKVMSMDDGGSCDVGTITTTLHIGTHADAPAHFVRGGLGAGALPLDPFVGPAVVVERLGEGPVTEEDVRSWAPERGGRYLLRSRTRVDPGVFPDAFAHLTPPAARLLAGAGVALFGIDTPSVDHRDGKTLEAHKILADGGVAILENLDLGDVEPGRYELIALPLRIPGADASPVRAVLRVP